MPFSLFWRVVLQADNISALLSNRRNKICAIPNVPYACVLATKIGVV
jgi:hypothetical protein